MSVPHGRGQRGPPKGSSHPPRRTRPRPGTFVQRIWAPRWCCSAPRSLLHGPFHAPSRRRPSPAGSAARWRRTRAPRRPAGRGRRRTGAPRPGCGPALVRSTRSSSPSGVASSTETARSRSTGWAAGTGRTSISTGTSDSSAPRLMDGDHRPAGQAPGRRHARVHLAQAAVVARRGVDDPCRATGVQVRMELLRRLGPVGRRRRAQGGMQRVDQALQGRHVRVRLRSSPNAAARAVPAGRWWRATPPSARCRRSRRWRVPGCRPSSRSCPPRTATGRSGAAGRSRPARPASTGTAPAA